MTAAYYDILEVSARATPETIRAAYKSLLQRHHPDKHGADRAAGRRTRALLEAYEVLSDAGRRAAYDARLEQARREAAARAAHEQVQAARRSACSRMHARQARPAVMRALVPLLVVAGLVALGALCRVRLDLPLAALGEQLRHALAQAGDWRALAAGGRAVLLLLLLSPTVSLLFMERRILLVLPLAFALGYVVTPHQAAACYNGSLETCIALVNLGR